MAASEHLTKTTTFRLSPEEFDRLRAIAETRGYGPSAFARKEVLAALGASVRPRRLPQPDAVLLAKVLGELGRIGSLANQITRVANATGCIGSAAAVDALRSELQTLAKLVLDMRNGNGDRA